MKLHAAMGRILMIAACLWIVGNALCPPWQGRSYVQSPAGQGPWQRSGGFGLARSSGDLTAPVWSPPVPHAFPPAVRWPWQSPWTIATVEIVVALLVFRISAGLVLLGVIARLAAPLDAPPSDRLCVQILWRWAWGALACWAIYIPVWLMFMTPWGDGPSGVGMLVSFAAMLVAVAGWTGRSPATGGPLREPGGPLPVETVRDRELQSWQRALGLVVGLVGGGFAGFLMAIVLVWLDPTPHGGGPDGGYGAAIGGAILALIAVLLGSVWGVALGYWWTSRETGSLPAAETLRANTRWPLLSVLVLAVTAAAVFAAAGLSWLWGVLWDGVAAATVLFWQPALLLAVLAFPWLLYAAAFHRAKRSLRPRWLPAAAFAGMTLAALLVLPWDLVVRFLHPASPTGDFNLLPETVLAQLGVLYLASLVYFVSNSRTRPAMGHNPWRVATLAGLWCAMLLVGRVEAQHHLARARQAYNAHWLKQKVENRRDMSKTLDAWLAGQTRGADGGDIESLLTYHSEESVWNERIPQIADERLLPLIELIDRHDSLSATKALVVELKNPRRSEAVRSACLRALIGVPGNQDWPRKECWRALAELGPEAAFLMPELVTLLSQKTDSQFESYYNFLDLELLATLKRLGPTAEPVAPALEAALKLIEQNREYHGSVAGDALAGGREALQAIRGER